MKKIVLLLKEWKKNNVYLYGSVEHVKDFHYIWVLLAVLTLGLGLLSLVEDWQYSRWLCRIILIVLMLFFIIRPMNAVYGLMGTSGSIRIFFINFLIISFLFSIIYYQGFFKDAGVSYDVNQPYVDYGYFKDNEANTKITKIDTLVYVKSRGDGYERDTVYQEISVSYQPIGLGEVFRNTVLTSLMQQPTNLFSAASTYNAAIEQNGIGKGSSVDNAKKVEDFHWILIFQILISWLFFGVFISLLYNKFRYES